MRPEGKMKLGYYPLPDSEAANIAQMLSSSAEAGIRALDPCAGTGKALLDITAPLVQCDRYAVELDAERARTCAANGIVTFHSDFADVDGGGTVSLVYCNPPYDTDMAVSEKKTRLEAVFLDNATQWLGVGGVLVFVVPHSSLHSCWAKLATSYTDVRVYRLSDPEAALYKQVVVFAEKRRPQQHLDYAVRQTVLDAAKATTHLVDLADAVAGGATPYRLKPTEGVRMHTRALPVDAIEDALPRNQAYRLVASALLPPDEMTMPRPPTPLHAGHVGLLCSAGLMNGIFGQGERRHSARWRTTKYTVRLPQTAEEEENGSSRTIERFQTEACILFASGNFHVLGAAAKEKDAATEMEVDASAVPVSAC